VICIVIEDLVLQIKKGDQTNINTLITDLTPLIISMIKKYGYYETFEENYQSSMVVLLESINEYNPEKNVTFSAFYKLKLFYYYMNIIKNQTDHINHTQDILCLEQIPEEGKLLDDHIDDLIWQENRTALYEAINKLSTRQKWIIEEHYFKGKKLTELSAQYNLHHQSLVKLKARALKLLKIYLKQHYVN